MKKNAGLHPLTHLPLFSLKGAFHPPDHRLFPLQILSSTTIIVYNFRDLKIHQQYFAPQPVFFWCGCFPQTSPTKMTFKVEEIFGHPVTSTLRLSPRGDAQEMWPLRCGRRAKVCTFLGEACYRSSGTRVAWRSEVDGSKGSVFKRITTLFLHSFLWITFPDVGCK